MKKYLGILWLVLLTVLYAAHGWSAHGVSIDGKLKYTSDFDRFEYASVQAKKGGRLILHNLGSFDKMNPFTLKGVEPYLLQALVFDTLAVASLDEPFSEYGLIAKDISVDDDLLSVTYTIHPDARFSDGSTVTVEDIAYSLKTLKSDAVHPLYPYYYKDITHSEILDKNRIRFHFSQVNRELPMIASQIPVFSERTFATASGNSGSSLQPPLGSGPYIVAQIIQGKSITYVRNPNYWGNEHPVRKGMYNYDTITVKYYKDQVVALEAFKAGEFDFLSVNIAKQWVRDLVGGKFTSGEIIKKRFEHSNNAGLQGFLMNTRKPIFHDRRVRQAIGLAFDFEWTNESLFYGQYTRNHSYFSNSHLAAEGLPTGLELSYLEPHRELLPKEVFTQPLTSPVNKGRGGLRSNLRLAKKLLAEAGWSVKDGVLRDAAGKPFSFEITLALTSFERVMAAYTDNLKKLGMQVSYRTIDTTLYADRLRNFDFDMIVSTFGQSLSPGNEQQNFWHSSAADRPGSRNYAGIKSKAVDDLIDKVIYAKTTEELVAASKALDRVLWYGYYLVPNWFSKGHRLAFHDKFVQPQILPKYYSPTELLMTWWLK